MRHPYVGIIQIRLWVEVELPLSKKLPKYSVYLVSIVLLHNIVKSGAPLESRNLVAQGLPHAFCHLVKGLYAHQVLTKDFLGIFHGACNFVVDEAHDAHAVAAQGRGFGRRVINGPLVPVFVLAKAPLPV